MLSIGLGLGLTTLRQATGGGSPALSTWDNTIYILAQGQSNMLQRNDGSGLFTASSRIKIWNRTAGALQTWTPANSPQHTFPYTDGGTGPSAGPYPLAWHVGKWIIDNTSLNVSIICVAWGEREIAKFATGSELHTELLAQLAASGAYIPRIDLIAWHQGESDTSTISQYFATDLPTHQTLLRGHARLNANVPFIFGELASTSGSAPKIAWNAAAATYAAGATNTALASASGLLTSDGTHFNADAGGVLGTAMGALVANYISVINAGATGTAPTAAITGFTATADGESEIDLAWTDSADASVTGYIIEMDSGSGFVEAARVLSGVGAYSVTGLSAATEYDFRIYAQNKYGRTVSSTVTESTDAATPVSLPTTNLLARWTAEAGQFSDAGTTPCVNNDLIHQASDQTAGGKNLLQATSALRPTYITNVQNGKPAMRFDGTRRMAVGSVVKADAPVTILVAGKVTSLAAAQTFAAMVATANNLNYIALGTEATNQAAQLLIRGGSAAHVANSSTTPPTLQANTPFVIHARIEGEVQSRVGHNGGNENDVPYDIAGLTVSNFTVGVLGRSSAINFLTGDIFEILVYSVELDDAALAEAVAYLRYNWAF